jgi:hypothetical protein
LVFEEATSHALSSTESEYIALSEAACKVKWVQLFLEELGIINEMPTVIYEDNQVVIAYATNQCSLRRMKHIDVKYHFTHQLIEASIIELEYMSTEEMVVDILMKSLPLSIHNYLTEQLGLCPPRLEEECWNEQAVDDSSCRDIRNTDEDGVGLGKDGEERSGLRSESDSERGFEGW